MSHARVMLLDHLDSFVHLLAEQFAILGADVRTYRATLALGALQQHIAEFRPHLVVLSPGPGHPQDATVTLDWLATRPAVPILGVCLGHQALAVASGGRVERGPRPVHGQAWPMDLQDDPLFKNLPRSFAAARYHSLVVTDPSPSYEVTATTRDGTQTLVMAMRHRSRPWIGFQFHPESFLSPHGRVLLERVLLEACQAEPTPEPAP